MNDNSPRTRLNWLAASVLALLAVILYLRPREAALSEEGKVRFLAFDLLEVSDRGPDIELRLRPEAKTFVLLGAGSDGGALQMIWKGAAAAWPQPGIVLAKPYPERVCLIQADTLLQMDQAFKDVADHKRSMDPSACIALKEQD